MGKRRIRNILHIGGNNVAGFDIREDRRSQVVKNYGIDTYPSIELALQKFDPDIFIISTPPDTHMEYAFMGFARGINCFIEASVVDQSKILELAELIKFSNLVIVPSCTMRYFAGPIKIKELIKMGVIGKVLNINYHTGQFLPDWHPYESVEEFYVSNRETGGARELVPFELTWINEIFGQPRPLGCLKGKLTDLPVDIDDVYHLLILYDHGIVANITVDVISRPRATRMMRILGSEGIITYSGEKNTVHYINKDLPQWVEFSLIQGTLEKNYINPEEPYIEEMKDFISAVKHKDSRKFPNSLIKDFLVLETLQELEKISIGFR